MQQDTIPTTSTPPATFEVGAVYECRSFCDHDCVWRLEVIRRTAKFVTLRDVDTGDEYRVGVRVWTWGGESFETCSPFGRYSMSPLLNANRPVAA